ncbi:hypothetical protein [Prevotella corporis]|uniref:hypothetical protein n=1 Tax=Prevotella corporis TaxID=28128 RepID=UPI0003FE5B89|nr:hypothetical protein [Prevotella corporis]
MARENEKKDADKRMKSGRKHIFIISLRTYDPTTDDAGVSGQKKGRNVMTVITFRKTNDRRMRRFA